MNNCVTYSLALREQSSETYYQRVRKFTDEVTRRAEESLSANVHEFTDYLRKHNLEELRSDEEYLLELLSFGLLWKSYGHYAQAVRLAPFLTLSRMAEW